MERHLRGFCEAVELSSDGLEFALCHEALLFIPLLHFLELFAKLRFLAQHLLLQLLSVLLLYLFYVLTEL